MYELEQEFTGGLIEFFKRFPDDRACRSFFESRRWPNGPVCPHCGDTGKAYALNGKAHRVGVYACAACKKQFTVTIKTIFEGTHIPLQKWFAAIYLMCSSKKGISAHQIHRTLGLTYKTAWFMCHRIRHAMRQKAFSGILSGSVEVDETYIGGPCRGKTGRGAAGKTIVFGMVERDGNIHAMTVPDTKKKTLQGIIQQQVAPGSRICSDEWHGYDKMPICYTHDIVTHAREYVAGVDTHVNRAESFFALLKRGIHGTFHHVGGNKLDMYCGEFGFRFNNQKKSDTEKFTLALTNCDGRLDWYLNRKKD